MEAIVALPETPLYQRVMGANFDRLSTCVRALHANTQDGAAFGYAEVTRGAHPLSRMISNLFWFPPTGHHPLHVHIYKQGPTEVWIRYFGAHRMKSILHQAKSRIVEQFGPLRFYFDLEVQAGGLAMILKRWTALGVPMPMIFAPLVEAREWADDDHFHLSVAISLPLVGLIVAYRGRLSMRFAP